MLQPLIKKGADLTPDHLRQMHALMGFSDPATETFIVDLHCSRMETIAHLYEQDGDLLAFQLMSWHEMPTPFARQPLPVLYANLSFKKDHPAVKNFTQRSYYRAFRDKLGPLWRTKQLVVTFNTFNPKGVDRIARSFAACYPQPFEAAPEAAQRFAQRFVWEQLQRPIDVDEQLFMPMLGGGPAADVTEQWQAFYAARRPEWNDFFIQKGVFEQRGDRIYHTKQQLAFFIGYYHPMRVLWKRWKDTLFYKNIPQNQSRRRAHELKAN